MELANPTFESRIYTIVLFDKETLQSTLSVYLPLTPKEETADKFEPFYEVDKGNLSKVPLRNFWPKQETMSPLPRAGGDPPVPSVSDTVAAAPATDQKTRYAISALALGR